MFYILFQYIKCIFLRIGQKHRCKPEKRKKLPRWAVRQIINGEPMPGVRLADSAAALHKSVWGARYLPCR